MPSLSFTVTSIAPDGDPVVHSCTTAEEEAAIVDELRAIGHTSIESTETRDYRILGKFSVLNLTWTRRHDEPRDEPADLEEQPALGHEMYVRIRPNTWQYRTGHAVPHPRGGLSIPYAPGDDVPGLRLLWQRAPRTARWRELVGWPLLALGAWLVGLYVLVVLVAYVLAVVFS